MGADIKAVLREEGCQPPPVARPHCVRVRFDPYNHAEVQALYRQVKTEFPKRSDKMRWRCSVPQEVDYTETNVWFLDFHFRDSEDAIVFGLKYSR